nr:hypothetical protein [Saprospiraceae bacterium]
ALENTQKKFALGATNVFELTSAQNALDVANTNLLISKYDYLFKLKIIDYYMGNPIRLNN